MSAVGIASSSDAATSQALPPVTSQWIQSPLWDGFWIFGGLWGPALAVLFYYGAPALSSHIERGMSLQQLLNAAPVFVGLGVLHRLSSTYTVLATPLLRDEVRSNRKRYLYVPLAIAVGCLLAAQAFAFHSAFAFMPNAQSQLWGFFALGYVMLIWERWHFCMQEFGILSIYRVRAKQFSARDRTFDRAYTGVLMLGVDSILFVCRGFSGEREVLLFGTPLAGYQPLLDKLGTATFVVGLAILSSALWREWRHPNRCWPKLGYYSLIGGHTLILFLFPIATGFFMLAYVFHHWMVAIGLFNRITFGSLAGASYPLLRYAKRVGPTFVVCCLWYAFFQPLDKAGSLTPAPNVMLLTGASTTAKVIFGFVVGMFFCFHFLHYYFDRCLYAFSNPAVRRGIAPLIFGTGNARTVPAANIADPPRASLPVPSASGALET